MYRPTGLGVTCEVMHQILDQVSHYGVRGHYNQYHPHKDVNYIAWQRYGVPRRGDIVHEIGLLVVSPGELEELPMFIHQLCEVPNRISS